MLNCKVVILDEPYRGLDVETVIILKKIIKKFVNNGGSILLSTHDLVSAENLCNRIAIVANGKMIEFGSINELKEKYQTYDIESIFMRCSMLSERRGEIEEIICSF